MLGPGEAIGEEPEIIDVGVPPVSLLSVVAKRLNQRVQTKCYKDGILG